MPVIKLLPLRSPHYRIPLIQDARHYRIPPLQDAPTVGNRNRRTREPGNQRREAAGVLAESAPGHAKPHAAACPQEAKRSPAAGEAPGRDVLAFGSERRPG